MHLYLHNIFVCDHCLFLFNLNIHNCTGIFILQEHSTLAEDEFYDAVESSNDNSADDVKQRKDQLLQCTKNNVQTVETNWGELVRASATNASLKHVYWPEVR